jgi:hypothetical protein
MNIWIIFMIFCGFSFFFIGGLQTSMQAICNRDDVITVQDLLIIDF